MEWLTQNWAYLLLLAGVILFMRFGGMGCGFGGRHAHRARGPKQPSGEDAPVGPPPQTGPVAGQPAEPAHRHHRGGCC